ncbi:MAG: glutamine--tRNA ligase/YqeY domain fusion protein [Candidatus Marinimicrobia bacterium]|mgnify:FL=1|jgi:glutaminyl-tRNA synthetase|nr:glutamine--tRNA ligase/YqeY domain fusion protein [Candidatus Neomarinimicrobiota bacterium]MBT3675875.1 glutamine--tRNA ligase/YqeY domain fusion protein [Candidatus Neomarinimicrobiota bacterium]MBT3763476.1 glutamine--tRNA ligase/YqeY domain fusion protein [Candidatus Neomarinimicrobiota bacterium]MBT4068564.1 glutamine--tRNA ligase/YqeY domain fusion protein [Candidatus Neomarinimicrobiota bacterium]MBT4271570.1 glutamine--tRNA ligase/YqeY domain fusion protein [Candidatus Neomarinimicro
MEEQNKHRHFIQRIIDEDNVSGKFENRVHTRFPPEPNGYLHIGHAKAICLNFSIANEFGGECNLRFDDTNPIAEEEEYVRSIQEDVKWLGFNWDKLCFASDYFQKLYDYSMQLVESGKAYVCDLTPEEIRNSRGSLTEGGQESPYRNRSVGENLDLFTRMKKGEFPDGSKTLRAKIDMAHPNMNMRDPVIYRILHAHHHRTKNDWCIYPMYDWAHGLEDSIEGVTHSLCSLEFEDHRPIYDWYLDALDAYHPQQIEFARLNLSYTIMSKRLLKQLVDENHVSGWDDPRMPTISGLRRRGYTPITIRNFMDEIGIAKRNNVMEVTKLEALLRTDLNKKCERRMAVLNPLKVVITNYAKDKDEMLDAINNPEDESAGKRSVPFSGELFIERDDFMEDPPKKFFRLGPGREVRLRYAYFIICNEVIIDQDGNITELHCTYDPETKGGNAPDGRKVKATLHWVSATHAIDSEVRLYDRLFKVPSPGSMDNFIDALNPDSLTVLSKCKLEPELGNAKVGETIQFERLGYFCKDSDLNQMPVFNRTVPLRDSWAKIEKQIQLGQKK